MISLTYPSPAQRRRGKAKKPATSKPKAKAPKKSPKVKESEKAEYDEKGLTENEIESYRVMAVDYPQYTPRHSLDWPTAYKYIDLIRVTTTKKEFQKIVKNLKGDVRLGMMQMLGY